MTVPDLARLLAGYRYPLTQEAATHEALARVLTEHGLAHVREHRLPDGGRLDFYLEAEQIGIEVKVAGGPAAVLHQCSRYLQQPSVAGLVLVTRRRALLPPVAVLHGKPIAGAYISAGVL